MPTQPCNNDKKIAQTLFLGASVANFNTSFVEMHPELSDYEDELPPEIIAAAIGAAIAAHEGI